jgi:hypothetical protein
MYSSNDRYFAAKMAAERREMMMQRASRRYNCDNQPQTLAVAMPISNPLEIIRSISPLNIITSLVIISSLIVVILLLALVLIPLGL